MQLLTKFETKSNRVKGIGFHPKRPWILASLHNGVIQLWDYRMGTLIERFEEHQGPVRGISFHPTQPLFVSGGDDAKIKVWNYKTRKCLFTLTGHLDYIRTVFFHHEYPWIISASDDHTIRIWNWQSRNCVAILAGHNHYVMSAMFHPSEDLVISSSMDQTVRVWDISALRKKNVYAPVTVPSFEDTLQRAASQNDIFGTSDAVVKFVLEGHSRGVNWASFHPTLPLIASAGDDRQIKIWRMNDTKAWEVDSLRGHFNNVWCVYFHPKRDLIVSAAEDKTIRVWDTNKRTLIQTFRRESERFWVLNHHPTLNLFAAGHDNGLMVFKFERERPAQTIFQNTLFYIRDCYIRQFNFLNSEDKPVITIRKLGAETSFQNPKTLSFNPTTKSILLSYGTDNSNYELYSLPVDFKGADFMQQSQFQQGSGNTALWLRRNLFVVLSRKTQQIQLKDLSNSSIKAIPTPPGIIDIFLAPGSNILISTNNQIILYDIQQRRNLGEIQTSGVKYCIWNSDMSMAALLSKHAITIVNKKLEEKCQIHETIRVKSAAWDESGVLIYTTLNHIKYSLRQGDNGIICTLEQPIYLTRSKGKDLWCLDREGNHKMINIDPTEYLFKLALIRKNHQQVVNIIKHSNLVGQSIISYLKTKGYPEVALFFVKDHKARFELAIECGNMNIAFESAKAIDQPEYWNRLAQEALLSGHNKIVEFAYYKTQSFDKLSFFYLINGNIENLGKILLLSQKRGDFNSRFQNALYMGNVEERIQVFKNSGQFPLAYATAVSFGQVNDAKAILELAGINLSDIEDLADDGILLKPLTPINPIPDPTWPHYEASKSVFESAFRSLLDPSAQIPSSTSQNDDDQWLGDDDLDIPKDGEVDIEQNLATEGDGVGWDIDDDIDFDEPEQNNPENSVEVAVSSEILDAESWYLQSTLALDHIAAGSFETAMQLLSSQIGVCNFEPLKDTFMKIYTANSSSTQENPDIFDHASVNPVTFEFLSVQLQNAYKLTTSAKFMEARDEFISIIQQVPFLFATNPEDYDRAKEMIDVCREYIIGLGMELTRQDLDMTDSFDIARALELSAYFTHCKLLPEHLQLCLRAAMTIFFKHKNYASARLFAQRLLDLSPPKNIATRAHQILTYCERNPKDAISINYDPQTSFLICAKSFTPLYSQSDKITSPLAEAHYQPQFKDDVCNVCQITKIGFKGSGLKLNP